MDILSYVSKSLFHCASRKEIYDQKAGSSGEFFHQFSYYSPCQKIQKGRKKAMAKMQLTLLFRVSTHPHLRIDPHPLAPGWWREKKHVKRVAGTHSETPESRIYHETFESLSRNFDTLSRNLENLSRNIKNLSRN